MKYAYLVLTLSICTMPTHVAASSVQWCGFNKQTGEQIGKDCFRTQKQCEMAFIVKPGGPNECVAVNS